jgi:ABC-2 type transport system permease protein
LALAERILRQIFRDRRTLALMLMAPLIVLGLMYLVLDADGQALRIAVIGAPADYLERLSRYDLTLERMDEAAAAQAVRDGEADAAVFYQSGRISVYANGAEAARFERALAALEAARLKETRPGTAGTAGTATELRYLSGYAGLTAFDNFGSVLIGLIIFFFVFLVSGISFLQERTGGTLEKLLSTPIRRREIVLGYLLGFGFFTVVQSLIVACFCVYVLHVAMIGSFALTVVVTLVGALMAQSLGMLLSAAAQSEFQMMQFIPLVIVPQVFFSGLFDLTPALALIGRFMPLYYLASALRTVMLRGGGFGAICFNLLIMAAFSGVFILGNILILRRHRHI